MGDSDGYWGKGSKTHPNLRAKYTALNLSKPAKTPAPATPRRILAPEKRKKIVKLGWVENKWLTCSWHVLMNSESMNFFHSLLKQGTYSFFIEIKKYVHNLVPFFSCSNKEKFQIFENIRWIRYISFDFYVYTFTF